MREEKEYKTCAYPNRVVCEYKKKDKSCENCIDVTKATNFLLNKIKPKSGSLNTGIINLDAVPLLMTEFANKSTITKRYERKTAKGAK